MTAPLVLDTAALIGMHNPDDHHHAAAVRFLKSLVPGQPFHLSNYILDETLTLLLRKAGHERAVMVARTLKSDPFHTIHQITEDLQEEALSVFESQGPRGGLSFTDCTTVALMRRLEIADIFTFDRDFSALSLTVRP